MKVLDVGAGLRLEKAQEYFEGAEIVTLDIDADTNPNIVADVTLPLPEYLHGQFDAVFLCHVLEHINWAQVVTTLRNLEQVLKPEGQLHVVVPSLEWAAMEILKPVVSNVLMGHLYGSQDTPYQYHRSGFTLNLLRQVCALARMVPVQAYQQKASIKNNDDVFSVLQNVVIARKPARTPAVPANEPALAAA